METLTVTMVTGTLIIVIGPRYCMRENIGPFSLRDIDTGSNLGRVDPSSILSYSHWFEQHMGPIG